MTNLIYTKLDTPEKRRVAKLLGHGDLSWCRGTPFLLYGSPYHQEIELLDEKWGNSEWKEVDWQTFIRQALREEGEQAVRELCVALDIKIKTEKKERLLENLRNRVWNF